MMLLGVTVVLSWLDFLIIFLLVCAAMYVMGFVVPRRPPRA